MKSKLKLIWLAAFGLALNPLAYADDHDIDVVEEGDTEYEYVEHISPNDNADFGTEVSNMARDHDSEYQGREFGQWVSEQAQDMIHENRRNPGADLGGQRPDE